MLLTYLKQTLLCLGGSSYHDILFKKKKKRFRLICKKKKTKFKKDEVHRRFELRSFGYSISHVIRTEGDNHYTNRPNKCKNQCKMC